MNPERSTIALQVKNEQLVEENEQLKSMLSLLEENRDLKARIQNHSSDAQDGFTAVRTKTSNTLDEHQFRRELQQTRSRSENKTSSPIDFKSFLQNSAHKGTDEAAELQNCQPGFHRCLTAQPRVFGEIAHQLDRRILSYVFQGQKRLYGFTMLNISQKIIEVSTNPLTGKVDRGYQLHLTQRNADLMEKLGQLGYKAALHPLFCEFVVNTYGILKEKPDENSPHGTDICNPDFLRRLIVTTAPQNLQKDLLVLLTCLCYMAQLDGKRLFLW